MMLRNLGGLICVLATSTAQAGTGALLAPEQLPPAVRDMLQRDVALARETDPGSFALLADLRAHLPELDRQKRGRFVPLSQTLWSQGSSMVLPMLERLVLEDEGRGTLSATAYTAWCAGLVEAVGKHRDPAFEPVWIALLDSQQEDPVVQRQVVEALAKLNTPSAAERLVALANSNGSWRRAALAGMGRCQRLMVAQRLVEELKTTSDPELTRLVVHSLGDVAMSQGTRALNAEEAQVRDLVISALVTAYVQKDEPLREEVVKAVLVVDHPKTETVIANVKRKTSPSKSAVLDELSRRFANSLLRQPR